MAHTLRSDEAFPVERSYRAAHSPLILSDKLRYLALLHSIFGKYSAEHQIFRRSDRQLLIPQRPGQLSQQPLIRSSELAAYVGHFISVVSCV